MHNNTSGLTYYLHTTDSLSGSLCNEKISMDYVGPYDLQNPLAPKDAIFTY
ncbi:hypothetical protein M153_1970006116 [Pseudoloma neurophilia]|uniref:Uncharacterized protein n=1 Tax=Pseudoloma neurophilia TaxID=146866 RepID=A0A0R0M510_9MICR|nr:hypothetical protein M153_1970006116 [Pseudoloma neurophilia]